MRKKRFVSTLLAGSLVLGTFLSGFGELGKDMMNVLAADTDTREWTNNPEVFQVNREKARATFYRYDSVDKAKKGDKQSSSYYQLLNGDDWKFSWAVKPADRIAAKDKNFNKKD